MLTEPPHFSHQNNEKVGGKPGDEAQLRHINFLQCPDFELLMYTVHTLNLVV